MLIELQRRASDSAQREAGADDDDLFNAEQNARVAVSAGRYYRTMFRLDVLSWNLRDTADLSFSLFRCRWFHSTLRSQSATRGAFQGPGSP